LALDKKEIRRLRNEIVMSEKLIEQELEPVMREGLLRYTGDWVQRSSVDDDINLNEVYPIVQAYLPAIFFRNPRVFLKPRNKTFIAKRRNPLTGEMVEVTLDSDKSARTQEHILNYAITEIRYKQEVRKVLLDALLFPYGVLWHGYKGNFGMTEEQSLFIKDDMIFVQRLSPSRFLYDPSVNIANLDQARWVARSFEVPIDDILDDDKLTVDKKELKGKIGFGQSIGTKDRIEEERINAESFVTASLVGPF